MSLIGSANLSNTTHHQPAPELAGADGAPQCVPIRVPLPPAIREWAAGPETLALIVADRRGLARRIAAELRQIGATALLLEPGTEVSRKNKFFYSCSLEKPEQCAQLATMIGQKHGAVTHLIHLLPIDARGTAPVPLAQASACLAPHVLGLHFLIEAFADHLRVNPEKSIVLAAAPLLQTDTATYECILHAGLEGLLHLARQRIPGLRLRVVRFATEPLAPSTVHVILDELEGSRPDIVVDYSESGCYGHQLTKRSPSSDRLSTLDLSRVGVIVIIGNATFLSDLLCKSIDRHAAAIVRIRIGGPPDSEALTPRDRSSDKAQDSSRDPESPGEGYCLCIDDAVHLESALAKIKNRFGRIDGVVFEAFSIFLSGASTARSVEDTCLWSYATILAARNAQARFCLFLNELTNETEKAGTATKASFSICAAFAHGMATAHPGLLACYGWSFDITQDRTQTALRHAAATIRELEFSRRESPVVLLGNGPWIPPSHHSPASGFPLLERLESSRGRSDMPRFSASFHPESDYFIEESGDRTGFELPIGAQIELILEACLSKERSIRPVYLTAFSLTMAALSDTTGKISVQLVASPHHDSSSMRLVLTDGAGSRSLVAYARPWNESPTGTWELREFDGLPPLPGGIQECYRLLFNKLPSFQPLHEVHGIDEEKVRCTIRPPEIRECFQVPPLSNWVCDPLVVQGGIQAIAIWQHRYLGEELSLTGIAGMTYYKPFLPKQDVECFVKIHPAPDYNAMTADVLFLQGDDEVVAKIEGIQYS